ncbi:MAG: type II secretion system minor pseudopilin GspJ [Gammaproteobacteria bacterium]|nr:type II secretion system minor pseudopilin GspJ [Gammaproteobacteria bacterium]
MKGYTLIEVIIALAIFAILGTLSVGLLSRAFDTKARLAAQIEPLSDVQLAVIRITQDASQIVARPVRDHDMKKTPAFTTTTNGIEFTRGGFIQLDKTISQSTLRRIALSCENHQLVRKTWPDLDGFTRDKPQKQILLEHLTHCGFSFTSSRHTWSDEWRGGDTLLPSSFKLYLNIENLGEIALVFQVPGGADVH